MAGTFDPFHEFKSKTLEDMEAEGATCVTCGCQPEADNMLWIVCFGKKWVHGIACDSCEKCGQDCAEIYVALVNTLGT